MADLSLRVNGATYEVERFNPVTGQWTPDMSAFDRILHGVGEAALGRFAAIGDSIIEDGSNAASNILGDTSWFNVACVLSNQRITYVRNAGITGQTSTQWAARVSTDVIAYAPSRCFVPVGSPNDNGSAIPIATTKANIVSIVSQLLAAGIVPVLVSMVPYNTAGYLATIATLNAWGARYAAQQGLAFVDFHKLLVDPTTGQYNATYTADGIHPNRAGARVIAAAVAAGYAQTLPAASVFLTDYSVGASVSLVPGGAFAVDTNADGIADNWIVFGGITSGTVTPSLVTDASATGVSGKWQQLVAASFVGTRILETQSTFGTLGSTFAVGDRVAFGGRIQVTGAEAGSLVYSVRLLFNGASGAGSSMRPLENASVDIVDGTFYIEGIVPALTTSMTVDVVISSGTGTIRVGQVTVVNMTQLGF